MTSYGTLPPALQPPMNNDLEKSTTSTYSSAIDKHGYQSIPSTKGTSSARDHLANERTYLAWIRTSLALLGASIALVKWDASSLWIEGLLLGLVGMIALVTSTYRYFHVMQLLKSSMPFEPNVVSILIVVVSAFAALATSFFIQYHPS